MAKHGSSLSGGRHLPHWLLPGHRSETGLQRASGAISRTRSWKDKYETAAKLKARREEEEEQQQQQQQHPSSASVVVGAADPSGVDLSQEEPPQHDCSVAGCQRVVLNVSGQRFETQRRSLDRFPRTLLGDPTKRSRFWDRRRNEFFIDRHRPSFQAILYFYQSGGRLRRPMEVPEDIFLEELEFYQMGERTISEYKEKEGFIMEKKRALPNRRWQRWMWLLCEEPNSSWAAKIFAVVSVACIVTSIVNFCLETIPEFDRHVCVNETSEAADDDDDDDDDGTGGVIGRRRLVPNYLDPFFVVESVCVTWFTVEFLMRVASCPSKLAFCRSVMNIFDVLAIAPFFVILVVQQAGGSCESAKKSGAFVFIRVLRVFRVFKLSKHSQGLRILGLTIKTSVRELGMFFFFLIIAMIIFSSAIYYAEASEESTKLTSIPESFWWAIVTMTTVGYGDIVPVGSLGKLVGTLCVIAGVLTIALPVPVVVANFNNFYRHESGRGYSSG